MLKSQVMCRPSYLLHLSHFQIFAQGLASVFYSILISHRKNDLEINILKSMDKMGSKGSSSEDCRSLCQFPVMSESEKKNVEVSKDASTWALFSFWKDNLNVCFVLVLTFAYWAGNADWSTHQVPERGGNAREWCTWESAWRRKSSWRA